MAIVYGTVGSDEITAPPGESHLIEGGPAIDPSSDTGDDTLSGGDGDDTINGYGGNNKLYGGDGNDSLVGGAGQDYLYGGLGADTLIGGDYGDILYDADFNQNDGAADLLLAGGGNYDRIYSFGGADTIDGGDGAHDLALIYRTDRTGDFVLVLDQSGAPTVLTEDGVAAGVVAGIEELRFHGGSGDDSVQALDGDDNLFGGAGNDTLRGLAGADYIDGGDGDDVLDLGTNRIGGSDTAYGGAGNDTIFGIGFASVYGGGGDDSITSNGFLRGDAGSDTIFGGDFADTINGGEGRDRLDGGGGDDYIFDDEPGATRRQADTLRGGDGNDQIFSYGGADRVDGGAGFDVNEYRRGSATEAISFTIVDGGDASASDGLTATGIEVFRIFTGHGADTILLDGASRGASATTGGGNDSVLGSAFRDTLDGGNGDDVLLGAAGNDFLQGGAGNDWLDGGPGDDFMVGGAGDDTYSVDSGQDLVNEFLDGGRDKVIASVAYALPINVEALRLKAAAGTGIGNDLDNRLTGSNGADRLEGRDGNDVLIGGLGSDTLVGGAGADAFRWKRPAEGGDTVLDFVTGEDGLQVSAAGFGGGLIAGALDPALFEANAAGVATQASTRFVLDTMDGRLLFDADGSGAGAAILLAVFATGDAPVAADIRVIA